MPHVVAPALGRISAAPGANLRRNWSETFRTVRAETERRAAPLSAEDQIVQSMADASPAKWHRAHTTWFFEQFLLKAARRRTIASSTSASASCSTPIMSRRARATRGPERGLITRPNVEEVAAYRAHVDRRGRAASAERRRGDARRRSFRSSRSGCITSSSIRS